MMKFKEAPEIHVGIVQSGHLLLRFHKPYIAFCDGHGMESASIIEGEIRAELVGGKIKVKKEGALIVTGEEMLFKPADGSRSGFEISDVLIGIGFHWEQKEDQHFPGMLKLILKEGKIQAINLVPLEQYLGAVISSEMHGDSSPSFLRAHTIISRSWLLAQIKKHEKLLGSGEQYGSIQESDEAYIRWYDREDHHDFHVCADDHCQRYQGISRSSNPEVLKAVEETRGEVLMYAGNICDARFSKCCGGVVEEFQNCWEPITHPYLKRVDDNPDGAGINVENLKLESNAESFIKGSPESFCNTSDRTLLSQVLNDYDRASSDFYRWELNYTQEEIATLIREKSGFDFGEILDFIPVERGESGRLVRLKIVGSKKTMIVGKELEIRRWLSPSHLYSSAFIVEKKEMKGEVPGVFHLRGAGWGHGVGLCQIGAAVMAHRGYSHEEILKHYFIDASINKLYE